MHQAARQLPFEDGSFDAAVAQLVVHFMADPIAGLREMARHPGRRCGGGLCVGPPGWLWPSQVSSWQPYMILARRSPVKAIGELQQRPTGALVLRAGRQVEQHLLWVAVEHEGFKEWWEPFTLGVGPAGAYTLPASMCSEAAHSTEQCW